MQATTLQARMGHPAFLVPDAMDALQALGAAVRHAGISPRTLELVNLRASQINGCGACAVQHPRIATSSGRATSGCTRWRHGATRRTSTPPSAPHSR